MLRTDPHRNPIWNPDVANASEGDVNVPWFQLDGRTRCHDLFILVDSHLIFTHYFSSFYLLVSQARYPIVCINSYVHPLLLLAISIPHLHHYHHWGPLQPPSNIPTTPKTCLQGRVRFHCTLATSGAGSNIQGQGLAQTRMFLASITHVLYLLPHQTLYPDVSCSD